MMLHGYWRSTASYRVRIGLHYKNVSYFKATYDLRKAEHQDPTYSNLNPQRLVPALEVAGATLTQSPAILEWLEEHYPSPPLLPERPLERAIVRAMANLIACEIHPLNNLRVLSALRTDVTASEEQIGSWINPHGAGFAYGNTPTMADCYLVPQLYSAERFGVDTSPFPALVAAANAARALPAFEAAHPNIQSDADAP